MKRKKKQRKKAGRNTRLLTAKIFLCILILGGLAAIGIFAGRLYVQSQQEEVLSQPIVCIDAGHGGEDCGAIGPDTRYEKDDNLAVALAVAQILRQQDISVVMTRDEDEEISLADRCWVANSEEAALFVSIHRNSSEEPDACGVEIWTATQGHGEQMAENILERLDAAGIQKNRGVLSGTSDSSESDYYVNLHTTMPSCLIELGFITNEEDNALLDAHLQEYAQAIADGIMETLEGMDAETETSAADA